MKTMSNIYTKELKTEGGLFLKWAAGDKHTVRIFGEGVNFISQFTGQKPKEQFATLVLFRNMEKKESEVKVMAFGPAMQKLIRALAMDPDWGMPDAYDIVIGATGEKLDREYSIVPKPKAKLPKSDEVLIASCDIDLTEILSKSDSFVRWVDDEEGVGNAEEEGPDPFENT